jgi:SPP1 gp7 family putative phage head morphogenesis protein
MADGRALYDDAVRRRIALERYSNAEARKALGFLKELERDLLARIAQFQADGRSALTLREQRELLASVKDLSAEIYERLNASLRNGMTTLAGSEHGLSQEALRAAAGEAGLTFTTQRLTGAAAFEIAAARPMQGALLKDWLADLAPRHRDRIERALRISFAEGESLSSAARRLRDAGLQNGRGLQALIRTSNAHIAAQVDQAVTIANADIIEGVEWVSVLDGRTTDVCRARDGKVYPVDSGPRPPAHIGCRSVVIKRLIWTDPIARETYPEWLKRQPAKVQDNILGPTRGKLFREGKFTVESFVDSAGRRVPLAKLR